MTRTSPRISQTQSPKCTTPPANARFSARVYSEPPPKKDQGKTHINKFIRQPIQRQLTPSRQTRQQTRQPDPLHLLLSNTTMGHGVPPIHILLQPLKKHLRRLIQTHLEDTSEIRRSQYAPRFLDQREERFVEERELSRWRWWRGEIR